MSDSNINIRVRTKAEQATSALGGLSKGMKDLGRQGNTLSKTMSSVVNGIGGVKRLSQGLGFFKIASSASAFAKVATDIQESVHMFNVSMGGLAVSTGKAVEELSEITGIDHTTMLDTVGEYNLLARSMGMASDNAQILSENTNKLALDLSALTNREYSKVAEDLRSGLIGQARTMYKYGVDVTEAAIQQEALNQGITKSVRLMGQGEKMALRYSVIMKQTGLAHGDFAETAHTAANQFRILQSRMLELSRSIGTIFLPLLEKILPYLNGITKAFDTVAKSIAKMLGYTGEMAQVKNTTSDFGLEELSEDSDVASKKIKELQRQLMGFDEINLYREDKGQGVLDEVDDSVGKGDYGLQGYDNNMEAVDQTTAKIADSIMAKFEAIKEAAKPTTQALSTLWDEGLSELKDFSWENLANFYNEFLKPVGEFTLGEDGIARLVHILNDMLLRFNWEGVTESLNRLFKALVPFAKFVITGLIDFVEYFLVPIWEWKFNEGLRRLADVLSNVLEQINWERINEGMIGFWKALAKLEILKMEAFMWLVENVLGPMFIWAGETLAPATITLFTTALETLARIIEVLKPTWLWFWDDVMIPFGKSLGVELIDSIESLTDGLVRLGDWFEENPENANEMAKKMVKFGGALLGLGGATKVVGKLGKSFGEIWAKYRIFKLLNTDLSTLGGTAKVASGALGGLPSILPDYSGFLSSVVDPANIDPAIINPFNHIDLTAPDENPLNGIIKKQFDTINTDDFGSMVKLPIVDMIDTDTIHASNLKGLVATIPKVGADDIVEPGTFSIISTRLKNLFSDDSSRGGLNIPTITESDMVEPGMFSSVGDRFKNLFSDESSGVAGSMKNVPTIGADDVVQKGISGKIAGIFTPLTTKISSIFGGISSTISGLLAIPGVQIVTIAALIAGAAYLIYDNWEEVKGLFMSIWEVIKPILDEIWEFMTFLWTDVLKPLWEALKPVLLELMELVGKLFRVIMKVISWLVEKFGPVIGEGVRIIIGMLKPALELLVAVFGNVMGVLEGLFKIINGIFELDATMIIDGLTTLVKNLFDGVKNVVVGVPVLLLGLAADILFIIADIGIGIADGIFGLLDSFPGWFNNVKDKFTSFGSELLSGIKEWWKKVIEWLNSFSISDILPDIDMKGWISDRMPDWAPFNTQSDHKVNYTMGAIPQLASGGIVDAGQMFVANEAGPEMVGKYGSKTGVVNNEQIVSAISEGVYKAVTSASMGSSDSGGGEAIMNIDGRELARIILPHMNREGKRQGYKPILNY